MKRSESCEIEIRVTPRASQNKVQLTPQGIKIWVTASPTDGEANSAVCALLAKSLHISKSSVAIVRGEMSRNKRVSIIGINSDAVIRLLERKS